MNGEEDNEIDVTAGGAHRASRPPSLDLRSSSMDLLDLVRSAEEAALVAARSGPPSSTRAVAPSDAPTDEGGDAAQAEEFVEVGDEAVEAPPSGPALSPAAAAALPRRSERQEDEPERRPLPPAIGIALLLLLPLCALYVLTR